MVGLMDVNGFTIVVDRHKNIYNLMESTQVYKDNQTSLASTLVTDIWLYIKRIVFHKGKEPSLKDINKYDGTCPICRVGSENNNEMLLCFLQTFFLDPRKLTCKHVFCNQCLARWLEVEATCPMCRAEVSWESKHWVNAGTSCYIQLI